MGHSGNGWAVGTWPSGARQTGPWVPHGVSSRPLADEALVWNSGSRGLWGAGLKGPGAGGESRKQRAEGGLEEEDPGVLKNARA